MAAKASFCKGFVWVATFKKTTVFRWESNHRTAVLCGLEVELLLLSSLEHLGLREAGGRGEEDNRGSEEKVLKVTDEQDLGRRSPAAAAVTAAIALTGVN